MEDGSAVSPTRPVVEGHGHLRHRSDIDGLRAVAVIPVVLFHLGFAGFSGEYVGVDVFFVISGFLITGVIEQDISERRF
jgi:peptidoglycan/LPS O-acetylase OafA/YrhL